MKEILVKMKEILVKIKIKIKLKLKAEKNAIRTNNVKTNYDI